MTEIFIYSDEMYPVFYPVILEKDAFWTYGRKCKWPDDLIYQDYVDCMETFHSWQDRLEIMYNRSPSAWSTTNSPSATPTSSTPTS